MIMFVVYVCFQTYSHINSSFGESESLYTHMMYPDNNKVVQFTQYITNIYYVCDHVIFHRTLFFLI